MSVILFLKVLTFIPERVIPMNNKHSVLLRRKIFTESCVLICHPVKVFILLVLGTMNLSAQTEIPDASSTVFLQILDPGTALFEMPSTNTVTSSGNGISGDNSQDWQITLNGSVQADGNALDLSSATVNGLTVVNSGKIHATGTTGIGINLSNGGSITNTSSGIIQSNNDYGIVSNTDGTTINNSGTTSGSIGINLSGNDNTITNTGSVTGNNGTAISFSGNNNTVILESGSSISGSINSSGSGNELRLIQNGSVTSNFSGFSSIVTEVDSGQTWTLSGAITTTGTSASTVNVQGTGGTLIITGTITHSNGGGTVIDSGATLQIGNGSNTGDIHGNILNNGTLIIFRSDAPFQLSSSVSGNGTVRFRGTGNNSQSSYSISNTSNSTFGGNIIIENGARLHSSVSNPLPLAYITVDDGGTLWLGTPTTFNSPVFVQGIGWKESDGSQLGALRLDSNAVLDASVTLLGNTRITAVFSDYVGTISGVISDGGNAYELEKSGDGLIILSGQNTYTGLTKVNDGTLAVNGSIAGQVNVASGKTLKGDGTIHGNTIINGILAPGNSVGIITFGNDLTLNNGATVQIEIDHSNLANILNDQMLIDGIFTIEGANLNIDLDGLQYYANGSSITLFTADSLIGQWASGNTYTDSTQREWLFLFSNGIGSLTQIPEPGFYTQILGLSAAALFVARRRYRK